MRIAALWIGNQFMQYDMADITHANKLTFQFNDQPIILFTEYSTSIIQVLI